MTEPHASNRRDFLKTTAALGAVATSTLGAIPNVHAAGLDRIKVGLIGCGGRGTGAVDNLCAATKDDKTVVIHALGDLFSDHLSNCRNNLKNSGNTQDKLDIADERCFVGFDAYQKVIDSGVDMVILATPPGFRPAMLEAAIKAGKNVFTEKPVGVDAPGIRRVLAAAEEARAKGLAVVAGTQRRHQAGYIESMKRVHDGAIGKIVAGRCYWNQGALWNKPRQSGWSDVEWQVRNWLYFTWLSGDHIVEQHVHNIDVMNWALGSHPVRAVGMGGRQVRTEPAFGQIFDHFAIDFEYPDGIHVLSEARQIEGCENNVSEALVGIDGTWDSNGYRFKGGSSQSRIARDKVDPYVQEHIDLIQSIRDGKPLNELKQVAESTLTAIMGRMSAYTGQALTWEDALNSKETQMPATLEFGPLPVPPVPMPGKTRFV